MPRVTHEAAAPPRAAKAAALVRRSALGGKALPALRVLLRPCIYHSLDIADSQLRSASSPCASLTTHSAHRHASDQPRTSLARASRLRSHSPAQALAELRLLGPSLHFLRLHSSSKWLSPQP
jgi:hypothetical protein